MNCGKDSGGTETGIICFMIMYIPHFTVAMIFSFGFIFAIKGEPGENQSVSMLWEDVARSPSTIALNVSLGHGRC